MSRGLSTPEMLHCTDMTVLERQRARMKWQQQGEDESYFSELSGVFSFPGQQVAVHGGFNGGFMGAAVKPDPAGFENGWLDPCGFGFGGACGSSFEANYGISRTYSCPPVVAAEAKGKEATIAAAVLNEKVKLISGAASKESFKKRKAEKIQNSKVASEDESKGKKMKGNIKEGYSNSKITHQNNSKSNRNNNNKKKESSEDSSKVTEVQKPDYIHVRARRGQATDSHSLAERVRREKISERMKYLQDLVPGCNKITGKAGMLDEIINYVQSLQRQVEFLSMKLATVNPRLDFNIEDLFAKEVFSSCPMNFPTIMNGMSSSEMLTNPINYAQFSNVQQEVVPCSGLEMGMINPPDMVLRRTISAPVSIPETYVDSSCFTQLQSSVSAWDIDLQNYYNNINMTSLDQARLTPATTIAATTTFTSHQPFAGSVEVNNLKMEM